MVAAADEVVSPGFAGYFRIAGVDAGNVFLQGVALGQGGKEGGPQQGKQAFVHDDDGVFFLFKSI